MEELNDWPTSILVATDFLKEVTNIKILMATTIGPRFNLTNSFLRQVEKNVDYDFTAILAVFFN